MVAEKPKESEPSQPVAGPPSSPVQGKKFIGDVVREVICDLSEKLGEYQQAELIKTEFSKFVKAGGDTSRQLAKFLEHVLKEETKMTKILKAINQSIIATPFIRLKFAFPKDNPFEDQSGNWKIIVEIIQNQEIVVTHKKVGSSKEPPPKGGFEFTWELVMKFSWTLDTMISASLKTTGITFEKGISELNQKQIQKIVDSFQ